MKLARLEEMHRGWFVGDFTPNVLRTSAFEAGLKHYRAGDEEPWHVHAIATEITLVVAGEVEMASRVLRAGDIVLLEPGEGTSFRARTDATTMVLKTPSVANDKHFRRDAAGSPC
jgi:quercetin dioxygenase-like cupin family protein